MHRTTPFGPVMTMMTMMAMATVTATVMAATLVPSTPSMLSTPSVAHTPASARQVEAGGDDHERAIRDTIEDFLQRLGDRQLETLAADFTDTALIVVSRKRDGSFSNSTQTAADWLARMRSSTGGQPFREPISNVQISVDSGTLAHVRADFEIVRDGETLASGVDHFTLVLEPDGWKIAVVAYTSIPRP